MKMRRDQNGICLSGVTDFCLDQIFGCGQAFRWKRREDGSFAGVVGKRVVFARQDGDRVWLWPCTPETFKEVLFPYFDLGRDYSAVKARVSKDPIMLQATAFGGGIRILKQDVWEMIVTFILSQRCSIPKIQKVVSELCRQFGQPIEAEGTRYYTFPAPEILADKTQEDLACLRCGYRDVYLLDAARKVTEGTVDLNALEHMGYLGALCELKKIKGIGDKVAQCILLFGLHQFEAFPVDTWILKAMTGRYQVERDQIGAFAAQYFGADSGFAQQYLFYCEREGGFSEEAGRKASSQKSEKTA